MSSNEHENDYVLAFDHFYTTNHIQIIKALLPYINMENAPFLPAVIKYLELKYTLSIISKGQNPTSEISAASKEPTQADPEKIYNSIKNYLSTDEKNSFKQLINMMNTMNNMKEMQQMMELMQSMNTDTSNTNVTQEEPASMEDIFKLFTALNN